MYKFEKIRKLTSHKTKQFVLTLNYDLIRLYKEACKNNGVSITGNIETHMIKFIDENGYLDD